MAKAKQTLRRVGPRIKTENPLRNLPGYKFEEFDEETGVLSIGVGSLIFETMRFVESWTWGVRTAESANWTRSKKRYGVLGASSIIYRHRGRAERAMRTFLEKLIPE